MTDTITEVTVSKDTQQSFESLLKSLTGRYAPVSRELARDTKRLLKWSDEACMKLANDFSSDLGRHLASAGNNGVKIGDKVNKDGQVTLREITATVKGVTLTESLRIAKGVQLLNEAGKWGMRIEKCDYETVIK